MAASLTDPKLNHHSVWRTIVVCLLTTIGLASIAGFTMVHWTERQVLTTSNWVDVVGPLPKNDEVANALSTYTVNQVFTATDLEAKIKEALPDRASFLAAPLTDQLETRLTKRTKQVIQSDKFESIWREVNQAAHKRLLENARNQNTDHSTRAAQLQVNLGSLKETVATILDKRGIVRPNNEKKTVGLAVNLKTSRDRLHSYIRTVDFLNATLWLLAVASLLGAIVVTRKRRDLLLLISSSTIVLALLQLIGAKAVRPYILNQIDDTAFKPAVGVVYDTLVASFRSAAITLFVVSLAVFVLAFVLHGPILRKSKTIAGWLTVVPKSTAGKYYYQVRNTVRSYRYQLMAFVTVASLAIIAFTVDIDWRSGVRSVLFILILIELVNLLAARPREKPMKQ